jgi:4-alpha-glucanotransferase
MVFMKCSSLSVFALHPQYLRVQELTDDPKLLEQISAEAKKLNALSKIDYEAVMAAKNKFVSAIWEKKKATFLASSNWKAWKESNQHWLVPYVVFCYLRDQYKTTDFNTWKQEHRHMTRVRSVAETTCWKGIDPFHFSAGRD